MLRELTDIQESDEEVWGCAEVSFTIRTRTSEDREIVERVYTFGHAPEWDKWTFVEFEEKRTSDVHSTPQNWRRTRQLTWDDTTAPTIDVPQEVEDELKELLGLDKITIQHP